MTPYRTVEADASNELGRPIAPADTVNDATGAWSGVTATPKGPAPTVMALPAVRVARAMGVTVPEVELAT
jgi:hypothetical protein